jgi:MraZ protein
VSITEATRRLFTGLWDQMREAPVTSKNVRDYTRVFFSGASEQPLDSQGRRVCPANGVSDDFIVIGPRPLACGRRR